ncbi:hypothetical protein N2152v2_008617 [Parachlorella kessleri]
MAICRFRRAVRLLVGDRPLPPDTPQLVAYANEATVARLERGQPSGALSAALQLAQGHLVTVKTRRQAADLAMRSALYQFVEQHKGDAACLGKQQGEQHAVPPGPEKTTGRREGTVPGHMGHSQRQGQWDQQQWSGKFGGRVIGTWRACAGKLQWTTCLEGSSHAGHYSTAAVFDPANLDTGSSLQPQVHNPLDHTSGSIRYQHEQQQLEQWQLEQRQQLNRKQEEEQPSLAGRAPAISGQRDSEAATPAAGLLGRMQQAAAEGRHAAVVSYFTAEQLGEGKPRVTQQALFELALQACAAAGDARKALQLVAAMWKRSGVEVSHSAHFSALRALCNGGELQRAVRYLSDIPSRRLQTFHCNVVLQGAVSRGEVQRARQVEGLLQRRRVLLDATTYSALIELRGLEGDATAVASACQQALAVCGTEAQPRLLAAKVIGLARAGALEEAIRAAEELMDSSDSLPVDISSRIPQEQQGHLWRTAGVAAAAGSMQPAPCTSGRGGNIDMLLARQHRRQQQQLPPLEYLRGACNAVLAQAEAMGNHSAAKHMTGLMTLRGLPPSTTTYNLLLRSAAKRTHDSMAAVHAVEEGMQEMQALGIVPNAETYELLLDAQGAAGDIDALRRCLEAVGAAGLKLSPAGWSRVMRHFGACGDLEGVGEAYSELRRSGARVTEGIFKAAFDAISAWGDAEVTQRALNNGPASSLVNRRTYQRQLAAVLLDRWVGDMEALGIVHTAASFISLLHAYSYSLQPEHVVQLMQRAFGPSLSGFGSLGTSPRRQQLDEAQQQQQQQQEEEERAQQQQQRRRRRHQGHGPVMQPTAEGGQGAGPFARSVIPGRIRPDARIFTAAIGACSRLGRLEAAVAMLRLMRESGLEPAVQTYTSLIALCAYKRMPGLARSMLGDMRERGLEPTLHTYNALLKVECHCGGGLDVALQLIQDMQHRGITPDEVSWRTVLSAAKFVGRSDIAELARKRLLGGPSGAAEPLSWISPEQTDEAHHASLQHGDPQQAQQHQQAAQQGQQEGWQGYYASNVGFDEDEEDDGVQGRCMTEAGQKGGGHAGDAESVLASGDAGRGDGP